jgi:Cu2+-exporting ATPase
MYPPSRLIEIAKIIWLSRASDRKMVRNLGWSAGHNALAPCFGGVLAGVGALRPAWVSAILLSLSAVIVALNPQRLPWLDLIMC